MLRRFDLFPKGRAGKESRMSGGVITIVVTGMAVIMSVALATWSRRNGVSTRHQVTVNSDRGANTEFHIDVSIGYPCHMLHLKMHDVSGNHDIPFRASVTRQRLDGNGRAIDSAIEDGDKRSVMGSCPDCLGLNCSKCCRTSFDIQSCFLSEGRLVPRLDTTEQFIRDRDAVVARQGCRVVADVVTEALEGELVLKAGGEIQPRVHFKNDLSLFGENVNLSHQFHGFQFGPGRLGGPLNHFAWDQDESGFYELVYRVKVVPSLAEGLSTARYAASFTSRKLKKMITRRCPGIYVEFSTDPVILSPFEESQGSGWFLESFPLFGGIFAMAGLLDWVWVEFSSG